MGSTEWDEDAAESDGRVIVLGTEGYYTGASVAGYLADRHNDLTSSPGYAPRCTRRVSTK